MTSDTRTPAAKTGRPYDIIVHGASGFTGALVCEYLARTYGRKSGVSWAMAGRSADKLKAVRAKLVAADPSCADTPLLAAELSSHYSLVAMARQARVVINCVGPYKFFGEQVVKACLEAVTDYVDITGEPEFVRRIVARYHTEAERKGVLIIHCAGFDSIPADLGTFFAIRAASLSDAATTASLPASQVRSVEAVYRVQGHFSNGTMTSAVNALASFTLQDVRLVLGEWYGGSHSLAAIALPSPRAPRFYPHRNAATGTWVVPMPVVDSFIVRRSLSFATLAYPPPAVTYGQYFEVSSFWKLLLLGLLLPFICAFAILARFSLGRRLLLKLAPDQRSGPSEAQRKKSWFRCVFIARDSNGNILGRAQVSGGDPGYTETAKMVTESALSMLELRGGTKLTANASAPSAASSSAAPVGGVLTTASALGHGLVTRLVNAGIKFVVLDSLPAGR
eukprot:Opistho-2@70992